MFFLYRLKLLIVKENEYHEIKEKKSEKEVSTLKAELTKLKAFALLVVKEQQCLRELLEEHRCCIKDLVAITDHITHNVSAAYSHTKKLKSWYSVVEQHNQFSIFNKCQIVMSAPSLPSEAEILKRKVVEMEGKDEELLRMSDQCRDIDRRLAQETSHCRSLRAAVDKINDRINEMDRIEEALGKSKLDCSILKSSLEQEREVNKILGGELNTLKAKVRDLEANEDKFEKSEAMIRQDLAKFRSLTVALVEERKTMAERLCQAEERLNRKESKRNEQNNLASMTEKVRDERQLTPTSKADLEEKIKGAAKEKADLQERLQTEEERNIELQTKLIIMKKRLQVLEHMKEREDKNTHKSIPNNPNHCQTEDNKVKELTKELDWLRKKLHDKEGLEGELMKVGEEFKSLEKRFKEEQKRCQVLAEELQVAKLELCRYDQVEKQEVNQEHRLLCRLQKEQVKSRLLSKEVDSLKEKLQKLVGTEESISKVQTDHTTLQRKLAQQEIKNRELAREMKELTSELEQYRKINNLTSGASREKFSALQTNKEVQTEEKYSLSPDYSEHNEKAGEECRHDDQNHNLEVKNRRSSLINTLNCLNSANNNVSQFSNGRDLQKTGNGDVMMVTHTPGKPLHIKVTPHHMLNTATLEISSPNGDTAGSYTSTAAIPTGSSTSKQRITIIQNSALSPTNNKTTPSSPDQTMSTVSGIPISQVLSPNSSRSVTPDLNNSPIQIVTVRTCSPEPKEVANQTVLCKNGEQHNSWQNYKTKTTETNSSVITTEDNKIHIHLGSPYMQSPNGMTHSSTQPVGPYYLRHEQRTQVLGNGCHVTGAGKITSSIMISPDTSPASRSTNITLNGLCD